MRTVRERILRFTEHIGRRRVQVALGPMLLSAQEQEIERFIQRNHLDGATFRAGYCMGAADTVARMESGTFDAGMMQAVQQA